MPGFSFASLRVRLILLVLLAVLPALGLTLYNAGQARQHAVAETQAEAQQLTGLTASNAAQWVEGARASSSSPSPLAPEGMLGAI